MRKRLRWLLGFIAAALLFSSCAEDRLNDALMRSVRRCIADAESASEEGSL